MARRPSIVQQVMDEPIRMPGCPDLIVRRREAYALLVELGYSTDPRDRFASVDYMVFGKPRVDLPLSAPDLRDRMFDVMRRNQ